MKNKLSSFATAFILLGFSYIVFLLYTIGSSFLTVQQTELVLLKKAKEVAQLEKKRNERLQTKYIMLSPQYQDRIAKESKGTLAPGEKEFIVPVEVLPVIEKPIYEKSVEELKREKSIPEQWNDVFLHASE